MLGQIRLIWLACFMISMSDAETIPPRFINRNIIFQGMGRRGSGRDISREAEKWRENRYGQDIFIQPEDRYRGAEMLLGRVMDCSVIVAEIGHMGE